MNIAILSAGEMGAAIGGALRADGHRVLTVLGGRGAETIERAQEQGFIVSPSLPEMLMESELLLSIVPPAAAYALATEVATAVKRLRASFTFVECNAVSSDLVASIASLFAGQSVTVVDGGIVGSPPKVGRQPRLYLSGAVPAGLRDTSGKAYTVRVLGDAIGLASALKLCYAAVTKGTNALLAAALVAADRYDLLEPVAAELSESQPELYGRAAGNISRLPADSARWAPELREIADAFDAVGVPGEIYEGAARMLELLAASKFGSETRRSRDLERDALDTVRGVNSERE